MGAYMTAPDRSPNNRIPNERVRIDQEKMVIDEDSKRQSEMPQSKRKSTGTLMDGSKNTKQPKTRHSEEMPGDTNDRRKSSAGGNEGNFMQHGEQQRVNFFNRIQLMLVIVQGTYHIHV